MARSALLNVMVQAAMKIGRSLARDFGEVENLQVSVKGPGDFVTAADHRAEKIAIEMLGRARPGYGFLGEETGAIDGSDRTHRWIVDPLDGTLNFMHGIPLFAVSIGLERDGELAAGVIYAPILNELYTAERGTGAFLNDRRMRVAARRELRTALVTSGVAGIGTPSRTRFPAEAGRMMQSAAAVRVSGSAALDLAWVASGRFDGYWQHGLSPWDLAAGIVLVREAGGIVTDLKGGGDMMADGNVVAAGGPVHDLMMRELGAAGATAEA